MSLSEKVLTLVRFGWGRPVGLKELSQLLNPESKASICTALRRHTKAGRISRTWSSVTKSYTYVFARK